MRRIYESNAISRDDDHFTPSERSSASEPQAARTINGSAWSKRLVPHRLRRRAVSVRVSTPVTTVAPETPIPFTVTMKNALPIPITIRTRSPIRWTWSVDDAPEASRTTRREPPDRPGELHFDRGERRQFRRRWPQRFKVSDREWEPADPGEYTISAAINVDDPDRWGLSDETTIRIEP